MAAIIEVNARISHSDPKLDLKVNLLPYHIGNHVFIKLSDSSHTLNIAGYQLSDLIDSLVAIQGTLKALGFDCGWKRGILLATWTRTPIVCGLPSSFLGAGCNARPHLLTGTKMPTYSYADTIKKLGELRTWDSDKLYKLIFVVAAFDGNVFASAFDSIEGKNWQVEVKALYNPTTRNKIECIKMVRDRTGMGLREAKEWVEQNIPGCNPNAY
jgi:hypothetical protein